MIECVDGGYAATYLIKGKWGYVAVDVGTRLAADQAAALIGNTSLRLICATHFHLDHIGGIDRLLGYFPEATVMFPSGVMPYASKSQRLPVPRTRRWITGLIPTITRLGHPLRNLYQGAISAKAGIPLPFLRNAARLRYPYQCCLKEHENIPWLEGWRIIETPGHTPDSICFYHQDSRSLISGDTILNMRGCGELNCFCCSWVDIQKSFKKLSALPVENIYPGHGAPICRVPNALARVCNQTGFFDSPARL